MCGLSLESQAPDMNDLELIVRNGAWRVGILLAMLGVALVLASPVASARQDPAPVRKAVEDLLRVEIKGLPGEASYTVDSIDENNNLQALQQPAGIPARGRTHVRPHPRRRALPGRSKLATVRAGPYPGDVGLSRGSTPAGDGRTDIGTAT
jgi:hypothetical protein